MRVTPQIRQATVDDAEMLTDLAARTFHYAFVDMNTPQNMQAYMSEAFTVPQLSAELSDPCSRFYVAEVEGVPAGYAKIHARQAPACVTGPRPIELSRLYVDQKFQGAGVANALMQTCLDEARSLGHRTIYLGVWEHNHRAQFFYFKWNFRVVGNHIFQMGSDAQIDWLMEREL